MKILGLFLPQIILILFHKLKIFLFKKKLLKTNHQLLLGNINKDTIYGEYGCGQSTLYVLKNFNIPILSVDSSKNWVKKVKINKKNNNLMLNYIDIGFTEYKHSWGRPVDYSKRKNFIDYANDIWRRKLKPNLVLIDGRLRVLCFLVSLKRCNNGTKIIFDDYVERKYYHVVEELIKPTNKNKKQCLFIVDKKKIDIKKLNFLINKFNYVLD
jgi:hypothetical protein